MSDLIDLIVTHAADPAMDASLRRQIAAHVAAEAAAVDGGHRVLVAPAERRVRSDPAAFTFDSKGHATLSAAAHQWQAGRFEPISIGDLKNLAAGNMGGKVRFFVVDGANPASDIGSLQANAGPRTIFQVASQFNCLESPGPSLVDVADYFNDPTQGPRAAISAFPGTLLRHYSAPDQNGSRFAQLNDGPQIELLAKAAGAGITRNGYLDGSRVIDPAALTTALERNFDQICIGLHEGVEVVLGGNWDGAVNDGPRIISQAFTSTVAGGMYGGQQALGEAAFASISTMLLKAGYLGTLLCAGALGCNRVVLTLIGGGAFRTPGRLILDAITWALREAEPLLPGPMDVILEAITRSPWSS